MRIEPSWQQLWIRWLRSAMLCFLQQACRNRLFAQVGSRLRQQGQDEAIVALALSGFFQH
jgi:hypothetical protein